MKYYWKVFKWENGKKTTDYTQYLTMPLFIEPHLDELLDTGEIILDVMPIETRQALPPKTKIRIERYMTADFTDTPKTYDFVVDSDKVEEFSTNKDICTHRIELIESSVIAQGMHVDNIALTYELQDVSLQYKTMINNESIADFRSNSTLAGGLPYRRDKFKKGNDNIFSNSYRYVWDEESCKPLKNMLAERYAAESYTYSFDMPKCMCQGLFADGWKDITILALTIKVTERHYRGSNLLGTKTILSKTVDPPAVPVANKQYNSVWNNSYNNWDETTYCPTNATGLPDFTENIDDIGGFTNPDWFKQFEEYKDTTGFYSLQIVGNSRAQNGQINTNRGISFTTNKLSQSQMDNGEWLEYSIEIKPYEVYPDNPNVTEYLPLSYERRARVSDRPAGSGGGLVVQSQTEDRKWTSIEVSEIYINVSVKMVDLMRTVVEESAFLSSSRKYSCYDLIRKALLTIDTQVIDNSIVGLDAIYDSTGKDIGMQYPIIISNEWVQRLKNTQLYETVFENKNLWEVLLQVGYYLHAIPYLQFATDGTDRFELCFKQLGSNDVKSNSSTKITLFNSQMVSEYCTQLDSYVTNFYSPQNLVEEWIVSKTSDSSYLISNDTAELHTKYNIQEILEFDILKNKDGQWQRKSALDSIFEQTVYSVLSTTPDILPSKAAAIYYSMGSNAITGLSYVPTQKNTGDNPIAIQKIISSLFGEDAGDVKEIRVNDYAFYIKYRTYDELRISQFRPDLQKYAKNSMYEKYPHNEQYYGQQDKIVDSERFSANLWGRLVRTANGVYQCQEYAVAGEEKEVGDLVEINSELYYVVSIENEYYSDAILQKVTYSKNFNQLSQVVTIPSEPRFYEVSERSMVRREVRIVDFMIISTNHNATAATSRFIRNSIWHDFVKNLLFAYNRQIQLPNFAYTEYRADIKRLHINADGQDMSVGKLFPNSETQEVNGQLMPKPSRDNRSVIVPLLHYPLKNALVFEWDMQDNFSAGDAVMNSDKTEYNTQQPVRYCDIMGRADLCNFKLFYKDDWTANQIQRLPIAGEDDYTPSYSSSVIGLPDNLTIGLDKDNREALSFNYQLNLLVEDSSYITFPNLFGEKTGKLKVRLLNKTVSMFENSISEFDVTTVVDNVLYSLIDSGNAIKIEFQQIDNNVSANVKSIVFYDTDEHGLTYICLAKNVDKVADKLQPWYIYPIFNE